jgi:hypothetical protein
MSLKDRSHGSRGHYLVLLGVVGLAVVVQFAAGSCAERRTSVATPGPALRIGGAGGAGEVVPDEQEGEIVGDVPTYDIEGAVAASFDGSVDELTPVPMDMAQFNIVVQKGLLPDLPAGEPAKGDDRTPGALGAQFEIAAPMPAPLIHFRGIGRFDQVTGGQAGTGTPPDPNGDVGLDHYIIGVNAAYGIYDKSTGNLLSAFTENSLFSSGTRPGGQTGTGTLCDTNSFGDPIVVYDQLADRWLLSHFAFVLNSQTGLWVSPTYICIAASKTSNPVTGGWWLYAIRIDTGSTGQPPVGTLADYPKFGNWNDGCFYMGANGFGSNGSFNGPILASFNKSDMFNGLTLRGALSRINTTAESSLFPSNLLGRAPGQMPPAGRPNYFVRNSAATSYAIRRFTPGADCAGGGTIAAAVNVSHSSQGTVGSNIIPQPNTTRLLDSLGTRLMQQVHYRKIGNAESVWVVSTARPTSGSNTRPLWAQINVTNNTIASAPVQQGFHAPDTTLYRWMASLAVDHSGNMALGYSTSNGSAPNFPSIAYAGRFASDPAGTLPQTETQVVAGGGSQIFTCGGANCLRWGDYTSMSVDPVDDCTFWLANQYYETQAQGSNQPGIWQTRIAAFKFPYPQCIPIHPVIACPGTITVGNDAGACGAVVSFTGQNAATATGDPDPSIAYSPASGSFFAVGTTSVSPTATNTFGDDSCSFNVTVNDTQGFVNAGANLQVTAGGFRRNSITGRYVQSVVIKNVTGSPVAGPIALAMDNLSSNATLFNSVGITGCAAPAGSPIASGTPFNLAAGASIAITLEFVNPTNQAITYTPRALAGS